MDKGKFVQFRVEGMQGGYPDGDGNKDEFRLTYDFNKVCEAEDAVGCHLLRALAGPASAKEMRGILYALLKTAHPETTLEEAGSLLSADPVGVTDAVGRCLNGETTVA